MKRPAKTATAARSLRKKSGLSARAKKVKTAHTPFAARATSATRRSEPSRASLAKQKSPGAHRIEIPRDVDDIELKVPGGPVKLTNLRKLFFPELKLTKRDLLQYYLDVSPWLLPHLENRAMVMKRYPNGIAGDFFFMKRAPEPRPPSIPICSIEHHSGNVIGFPVIQHLSSLLWVVNLGCIDLNPWYARCDDVDGPDYLHFDLDPVEGTPFEKVLETALIVRDALAELKIPSLPKTTGSRGVHVYVAIERGPRQKQVWEFAKAFSKELEKRHPDVITAEYRVAHRPKGRVLVDYNQNAWNRTLASVYSVRPKPAATVSTPVTWKEVEHGIRMEDFTMLTVPPRVAKLGDLWKPILEKRGRVRL
ncbi:MAG: non-homologous end-joining DNA ligase, partial [Chthoniobacterales bacterium]